MSPPREWCAWTKHRSHTKVRRALAQSVALSATLCNFAHASLVPANFHICCPLARLGVCLFRETGVGLRRPLMCLMWSSSSHIARGHWANTQPSAVRPMRLSNALTSTECCAQPLRHHVGGSDSSGPGRPDLCHTWHAWNFVSLRSSQNELVSRAYEPQGFGRFMGYCRFRRPLPLVVAGWLV